MPRITLQKQWRLLKGTNETALSKSDNLHQCIQEFKNWVDKEYHSNGTSLPDEEEDTYKVLDS